LGGEVAPGRISIIRSFRLAATGSPQSSLARVTRPGEEDLARPLETASAEELGKREGCVAVALAGQRCERREHGLRFLKFDAPNLTHEPRVPAKRRSPESLRLLFCEEQAELEGLGQSDMLELGRGRQRFGDVASIERTAEASVGRTL
jgi:hypothetical protein